MTDIQDLYEYICKECNHSDRGNKKAVEDIKRDRASGVAKCPVCYKNNIKVVSLRTTRCANCRQTWRTEQTQYCWCTPKGVGIQVHNPYMKSDKRKDEIDMGKSQRILQDRVELERLKIIDEPRKLLQQIADKMEVSKSAV